MTKQADTTVKKTKARKPRISKADIKPLNQKIADKIISALERGVKPWEECYSVSRSSFALRVTGEPYKGINRALLTIAMWEKGYKHPVWMTYRQAQKLGGRVIKGEQSSLSLFFKPIDTDEIDPKTGELKIVPMARKNLVFNVEQIEGLSDDFINKFLPKTEKHQHNAIESAIAFVENTGAKVVEADGTPCFRPKTDTISMPPVSSFVTPEAHAATLLHELVHWTMLEKRLNRPIIKEWSKRNLYFEELVADLGAAFLLPTLDIEPLIDSEHAPYLDYYIKLLKDEPQAFISACSQAEKAVDYLESLQPQKESKEDAN